MPSRSPSTSEPLPSGPDLRARLRRCHDLLHARGAASGEEDLALDMVRILVAKVVDDAVPPLFFCSPEEAAGDPGPVAARVRALFEVARGRHPGVFGEDERIGVDDAAIRAVVRELQHAPADGDALGLAWEEYTATALKRQRGQYFTNRLVVDLLVEMTDPRPEEAVLDPCGGAGGFLSGTLRRRREGALFLVEASPRLTKIAKAGLILRGADPRGVVRGDGLGPISDLVLAGACGEGEAGVVLTNPPFAGSARVTDPRVLAGFECGRRPGGEPLGEGAPPEMLFLERSVRWLAPGGRLGIVLPKSSLDTATWRRARALLARECQVRAVVLCHPNTFQPHTGVRAALVVARRRRGDEGADPPVFMAISRACGQDSEGRPVFAREGGDAPAACLEEDLTGIAADWRLHLDGRLPPSDHRFLVPWSAIDPETLNVNPQSHRPSLNATLVAVAEMEGAPDWEVRRLDALARVFKCPRLRTEDLVVDAPGPGVEPYFTPTALLQERAGGAKLFDLRRASAEQRAALAAIRARRGDLVITRSGTIGRVAIVTAAFDGALLSDDLVRVRAEDEATRLYLWAFLESRAGRDQMMRNEYGAIQQHLEPEHVAALLVPLPRDPRRLDGIVGARRAMLAAKEALWEASDRSAGAARALLGDVLGEG